MEAESGWPARSSSCRARDWFTARASLRTNALPGAIRPAIVEHLANYVQVGLAVRVRTYRTLWFIAPFRRRPADDDHNPSLEVHAHLLVRGLDLRPSGSGLHLVDCGLPGLIAGQLHGACS